VVAAAVCVPGARASERVTLRNEAVYTCAHHAVLGDETRLYFGDGDANYQDILSERIASIAVVPDVAVPAVAVPAAAVSSLPHAHPAAGSPTSGQIEALLQSAGAAHDIDVELLASVVKVESDFRVDARSRVGARGLMQLMPGTARANGVTDVTRADQNIKGGTAYLDALLKRYHDDAVLALAAYNAGPGAVDKYRGVPPYRETRWYVYRVIREYNRRKQAAMVVAAR
jgi:soluble lytic murein transglycosylase-like protein